MSSNRHSFIEREQNIKISSHARVLVFLDMADVPALSLDKQCFDKLQSRFNQLGWSFCTNKEEFLRNLSEAEVVLCWNFTSDLYALAPKLQAIFTPAAGKDWIESDPAGKVKVHHSHFHGTLMAESLLGMISHFNNAFDHSLVAQLQGEWDRKLPKRVMLNNQHIIIVGYGSIGQKCAEMLRAMNCRVTGVKRSAAIGIDQESQTEIILFDELLSKLPEADHVVLILPGDKSTTGIITREHLSSMKPSAVLHNMGRGNCVKEEDLLWALTNNIIKGAALDVFEQEPLPPSSQLWQQKNVLLTPHSTCFYDEYGYLFAAEVEETLAKSMTSPQQ